MMAPSKQTRAKAVDSNSIANNQKPAKKSKKASNKSQPATAAEEQALVDRIIDERGDTTEKKSNKKKHSKQKHEYLCTWMDGAAAQWVDASELEGSAALEDWQWREEAQPELFDSERVVQEKSRQLAESIRTAKRPVFLLGAGISAPVLPTFRGKNGLWTKDADKNQLASATASTVKPTLAHRALAALERHGHVHWVATQNYDDMSQRSGFPQAKLSELHGNIFTETCTKCQLLHRRDFEVPLDDAVDHETGRSCDACGGALKDSIVHFDEGLPWHELKMANAKFLGSDVAIVLGSSLRVEPAASLPFKGKRRSRSGRHEIALVNLQPTRLDDEADLIIRAKCDHVMDTVAKILIGTEWDSDEVETQAQDASS